MNHIHSVGFAGAGRATRFLLEGWKAAGSFPENVCATDCNAEVLQALISDFPEVSIASAEQVATCDLLILAVHPPVIKEVLETMKPHLSPETIVLSLAPKFTVSSITALLDSQSIVRMIPNAPSAIGKGFNPVFFSSGISEPMKESLLNLFGPWGESPEIPENDLEAYALLTAMGPTYMWFQWQTLRELAADFGLSADAADQAILRMISGSAEFLLASAKNPDRVMDTVPVKPLKDDEPAISEAYRSKLTALYHKIKP